MVIVDGNNVMGQRVGWHRDKGGAVRRLIAEVEAVARSRSEPHILVFDAKPESPVPDSGDRSIFDVQYASRGGSADTLILELVVLHRADSNVSVVTSDRALARQASVLGAKVLRSGVFRRMLEPGF